MHTCVRCLTYAGFLTALLSAAGAASTAGAVEEKFTPIQIVKQLDCRYPRRLLEEGITSGEVQMFLEVDAHGALVDHLFVAYTHYEFANEVSRTVPRWRFRPAAVDGRPIASTVMLTIHFRADGVVVVRSGATEKLPTGRDGFMFRARELSELDWVPHPLSTVMPGNPTPRGSPPLTGRVQVQFYIDEKGHVRMPIVAEADDERLGWAALAAIRNWTFEIPTRGGYPVLARATQVFIFRPDIEE